VWATTCVVACAALRLTQALEAIRAMTNAGQVPTPPPLRDGLAASCVVLPSVRHTQKLTVLDGLEQRLPALGRDEWRQRLAQGLVVDALGHPVAAENPYRNGWKLYYWRHVPDEPVVPFAHQVLFQDAHLVVADKPHFLPVLPAGRYVKETLLVRLKRELNLPDLTPVHRLDRETAGLVLLAVRPKDRDAYQRLFRERHVRKLYEALAPLGPDRPWPLVHRSHLLEDETAFFRMREACVDEGHPVNSETRIELMDERHGIGLYRLDPHTGKRHQLRVHLAALGRPIHGDQFYPVVRHGPGAALVHTNPLRLLARELAFIDPVTGQKRLFRSERELDWPDTQGLNICHAR
jgi:tRNA pseudouridine32 synthase / 23S rRNA pseudouridine746 synthase